jgi:hypothetical protein
MASRRADEYANTLSACRYAESVTFSSLIISTRRRVSAVSRPTESVLARPSRSTTPLTNTLGESKRKRLATFVVRNDFVVARK